MSNNVYSYQPKKMLMPLRKNNILPNFSVFNVNPNRTIVDIQSQNQIQTYNQFVLNKESKKKINNNSTNNKPIELNPFSEDSDEVVLTNIFELKVNKEDCKEKEEENKEEKEEEDKEEVQNVKKEEKIINQDIQKLFKDLNIDLFKLVKSEEQENVINNKLENRTSVNDIIKREDRWSIVYNSSSIIDNIELYQNQFKENYKFKIDTFLNERFAEQLYNYIIRMPEHHFNIACGIRNTKYEKKIIPQNYKRNQDNINEANKTFAKGEFSYVFNRGMNNTVGEISQMEMIMRNFLNSNEFKELLSKITGLDITNLNTMFLSKYKAGNFLSPHSDKGNGKIAFVINLSKNWLPHYGGNLHFLSEDRKTIVETWTPAFNNLVVFYVPPDEECNIGLPHFVSHVNPGIKLNRYAITGWYS